MAFERGEWHELGVGACSFERIRNGALFIDGEQDVGLHADDECAFRRGALERSGGRAAVRRQIEAIDGAR